MNAAVLNRNWRSLLLAGCAAARLASAANESPPPGQASPLPYMRVTRPDSNTVQLQIAARKFVPARGDGPAVWLTGAIHLGESNYFRAVQAHLDAQGLVLFEGIKPQPGEAQPAGVPDVDDRSLQVALAESLGLAFQLKAVNYRRPHFRNSDLSIPELQKHMTESLEEGEPGGSGAELAALLSLMDGSSFLGGVVQFGVRLLGTSTKLQALARLALIETVGQLRGDLSQMPGLPPEMKKLMQVLIQSRNQAVLRDLKAELEKPSPARSISIFYGAAHMPDMEDRLRKALNGRLAEEVWFTAISVEPAKAGVTATELGFLRALIQGQMEELQKAPKKPEASKAQKR